MLLPNFTLIASLVLMAWFRDITMSLVGRANVPNKSVLSLSKFGVYIAIICLRLAFLEELIAR